MHRQWNSRNRVVVVDELEQEFVGAEEFFPVMVPNVMPDSPDEA